MALKIVGGLVLAVVALVVVAAVAVFVTSNSRLGRSYSVAVEPLNVPDDPAAVERGKYLVAAVTKCADCHGDTLGGQVMFDAPPGRIVASNLTRGQGGIGSQYQDADWVRAIRHGVNAQGRALMIMPSEEFYYLGDDDLAAIIAYVKSVPPVDNVPPQSEVRPLGRALFAAGQLPLLSAERIDHGAPPPPPPARAVDQAYGRYLAVVGGCVGCHQANLSGGPIPGTPPDVPPAANITPAGIGNWSEEDFFKAMRTGTTPDGRTLNLFMPWPSIGQMTDDDLRALWLYLKSVPPREGGG